MPEKGENVYKPVRSPTLIAEQRQKVKTGIARIKKEFKFDNLNQMKNHLLASGTSVDMRILQRWETGEITPTAEHLNVLWKVFQVQEFNPDAFGPTVNGPEFDYQREILHAVTKDLMQRQGITTASQLASVIGLSTTSSQILMSGKSVVEWASVEQLRAVTNDPRLEEPHFSTVPPGFVTRLPKASTRSREKHRHRATTQRPQGRSAHRPHIDQNAPLPKEVAVIVADVVRAFKEQEGISNRENLALRLHIRASSVSQILKGNVTVRLLQRLTMTIKDPRLAHLSASNGAGAPPEGMYPASPEDGTRYAGGASDHDTDLRFLVTAQSFQPLDVRPTEAEITDTQLLLKELTRRLGVFSMVQDDVTREQIQNVLGPWVEELYLVLQILEAENPSGVAEIMKAQRESFRAQRMLRNRLQKGGR